MSRIGIKPITVPESVNLTLEPTLITVKGPKGELMVNIPHGIKLTHKGNELNVARTNETKQQKALHGTIRSLVNAAVLGVVEGFEKKLEMVGIGYRSAMEGNDLVLSVGFTHPVKMTIPEGISVKLEKNVITVAGIDKQKVGQFSAVLRSVKKPDAYKGKGIRYQGENVRIKQGKAVKSGS